MDGERVEGMCDWQPGMRLSKATVNGLNLGIRVARKAGDWLLTTQGATHRVRILPAHIVPMLEHMIEKVPPDLSRFLLCPMPGLLTAIHVESGEKVEAGQPLAVVEAMKMENILRAEKSGVIKSINASKGDSLAVDTIILELE